MSQGEAITGRVGTVQGRIVEIARTPHHIEVRDAASPHTGHVLNVAQAEELAQALLHAVRR